MKTIINQILLKCKNDHTDIVVILWVFQSPKLWWRVPALDTTMFNYVYACITLA